VSYESHHKVGRSRREFLLACGLAASSVSVGVGCRETIEPSATTAAPREDVPLRVALCGSQADREVLQGGWAAVSSQPLDITTIDAKRDSQDDWVSTLCQSTENSDLVIYPTLAIADLAVTERIAPLSDDEWQRTQDQNGVLHAALRNGVAMYSGNYLAVPLGCNQPAIIATEPIDAIATWSDYDHWVQSLDGAVAEPLADGWAAAMFLWRAASTIQNDWLFGREQLDPLIDSEPYQQVLAQMRETAKRYKNQPSGPEGIWSQLNSGELKGAVGFALPGDTPQLDFSFHSLPAVGLNRVFIDPFAPVASLSARCRQSANSKKFIRWLAGGEGVDRIHQQIHRLTMTTVPPDRKVDDWQTEEGYDRWLSGRLRTPSTVPTLKLHSAPRYYAALDQQVVGCLQGQRDVNEALAAVKDAWTKINREVGIQRQQRAWRRAQA
jgi:hypothetical protein